MIDFTSSTSSIFIFPKEEGKTKAVLSPTIASPVEGVKRSYLQLGSSIVGQERQQPRASPVRPRSHAATSSRDPEKLPAFVCL